MEKQAEAIWQEARPPNEAAPEKPVLVKAENQWNHEEEIFNRSHIEHENHREKVQRLVPGMDLKRWIY